MAEKYRTGLKKLNVYVPEQVHNELKRLAKIRNISVSLYVRRLFSKAFLDEKKLENN